MSQQSVRRPLHVSEGAEASVAVMELPGFTARWAAAIGRAALEVVRHPQALIDRARRLLLAAPMLRQAVAPILTGRVNDWRAEYAYTAGVQAFIYGFPYIYNTQLRHDWVTQPRNPATVPYAAVNHFWHASHLMDATYRDGGCPNNDTLYSLAWLNLGDEPVNPANRYSVGDRTPGLRRDPDGGLTIHLQPGSLGAEQEPNWLPTSAENAWFVILRMYRPHPAVVEAKWECPGITRLS